ncbi:MAG: DNA alkylation repair protein [Uliginosibacterium sp.]|nr:DNA alkylation repair protein [Uliginosibacterium sp.]
MPAPTPKHAPSPQIFATQLRAALCPLADPARAAAMATYMQQRFAFFGIPTPARRAATRPLLASLGRTPDADWLVSAAEALWQFDERECQYAAVDMLVKFAARIEARHEPQLARLVQARAWWDSVDLIAAHVYGSLCRREPALQKHVEHYARHEDIWLRRVALLHQLGDGPDTDYARLDRILTANLGHPDFFIRKAMGWALRTDPTAHPGCGPRKHPAGRGVSSACRARRQVSPERVGALEAVCAKVSFERTAVILTTVIIGAHHTSRPETTQWHSVSMSSCPKKNPADPLGGRFWSDTPAGHAPPTPPPKPTEPGGLAASSAIPSTHSLQATNWR